jgi:DNA primase
MTQPFRFPPGFVGEVRARTSLVALIGAVVPLKRAGKDMAGCCPFHNERSPSFYVVERKGFWFCFGCGAKGSAIDFRMRYWREDFGEAVRRLAADVGLALPGEAALSRKPNPVVARASPKEDEAERLRDALRARDLWRRCVPAAGTLVETYLRARGITIPVPPSLRFYQHMPYWIAGADSADPPIKIGEFPAMVAPIQARDSAVIGLHRTYLAHDGSAKLAANAPSGDALVAKKMTGRSFGGAVRFTPARPVLAIGEGIETCLTVLQARPSKWGPDLAVWAALSLGNLAGGGAGEGRRRAPDDPKTLAAYKAKQAWPRLPSEIPDMDRPGFVPPEGTRELILLADADNKDPPAAEALLRRAANRYAAMGLTVSIARPAEGHDFNSMLRADSLRARDGLAGGIPRAETHA